MPFSASRNSYAAEPSPARSAGRGTSPQWKDHYAKISEMWGGSSSRSSSRCSGRCNERNTRILITFLQCLSIQEVSECAVCALYTTLVNTSPNSVLTTMLRAFMGVVLTFLVLQEPVLETQSPLDSGRMCENRRPRVSTRSHIWSTSPKRRFGLIHWRCRQIFQCEYGRFVYVRQDLLCKSDRILRLLFFRSKFRDLNKA